MAKKFFYDHVHNTRRTIINAIIIGICVIGIIICFIVTRNFEGEDKNKPQGTLSLKSEATVEVNEKYSKDIFFAKIENVELDDIDIEYPENFDISKAGEYDVKVTVGDESHNTKLKVVDTIMPELEVKEVTINENDSYKAKDFVKSCTDNSNKNCTIAFYKAGTDEDGNKIDYSAFKESGTYSIKISAKDDAGNENVKETKLIIKDKNTTTEPEKPSVTECKYGNTEYDTNEYLLAVDKSTGGCAVSIDLYKNEDMTKEINNLMETETVRIQKDVRNLKIPNIKEGSIPALNRKATVILNKDGSGIVGYELRITINVETDKGIVTVVDYKVDDNGKRVFISNDYNLPS